ncbi:MAG: redoxin family protein [Rhizobiaceae bacterium]|nr:redoxin family protein [Rhizobiaceae bacterium]
MPIEVGDKLPEAEFIIKTEDGLAKKSVADLTAGRKIVLFSVPGAFTPTCHSSHLPGFIENADAIREKGVDEIAVVSVNDVHVLNAWAEATKGKGKITFLADGNADFANAIGMAFDMSAGGMGTRSKRYSMIVDDGIVTALNQGDVRGQATISSAVAILKQL